MELREAQELIKKKYLERDSMRGLFKSFTWLVEEIGELGEALLKGSHRNVEEEIADVIAWTLSIANLAGVDVEEAFKEKYCQS
ncbi:MAG: nucleotide pyrophosphohydrolase [Desulfurococcales archaeon]|nr:nucleotide pyrophosphohydrolase [Desulfurococcales archaeon]MEB3759023.1 nucleotide pyrophosphohydrolase [Desulfurococcales archaeon]MEB3772981.1 nucleotide pyrophosphohydrolase [Desulfurococcales archaeon]MEB3786492.1 nucleotide pyrophosphohydrolase [Desulfurococcales archaeon]MEB3799424.1 nucleotide pyrophosphohydrolase [Desulfurococcales archaeon]